MCSCPCHQGDTARAGHSWPNCRCVGHLSESHRWVNFKAEGWTLTRQCQCGTEATSDILDLTGYRSDPHYDNGGSPQ